MKRSISLLFGLVLAVLVACDEEPLIDVAIDCVEVRVVTELCNQAVIQVVNPGNTDITLSSYEFDGVTYNNVFKTFFHCQQMPNVPLDGTSFYIQAINEEAWKANNTNNEDCFYCEPLLAGELPFSYVEIVNNCQGGSDL